MPPETLEALVLRLQELHAVVVRIEAEISETVRRIEGMVVPAKLPKRKRKPVLTKIGNRWRAKIYLGHPTPYHYHYESAPTEAEARAKAYAWMEQNLPGI